VGEEYLGRTSAVQGRRTSDGGGLVVARGAGEIPVAEELSEVVPTVAGMEPLDFQVTFDAAHPHALADWWAETLGWEVEPNDEEFIRKMVAEGFATDADTDVHRGALVWKDAAAISRSDGRRIYFQQVPEPKSGKNRMHLDLRPAADDLDARVAELVARGASVAYRGQQGPHVWMTLADPEGNEFCVS
jgi:hypothetical protein